jgi:hypothetical protein
MQPQSVEALGETVKDHGRSIRCDRGRQLHVGPVGHTLGGTRIGIMNVEMLNVPPRQEPNTIRRESGVHTGYQSRTGANVIRDAADEERVRSQTPLLAMSKPCRRSAADAPAESAVGRDVETSSVRTVQRRGGATRTSVSGCTMVRTARQSMNRARTTRVRRVPLLARRGLTCRSRYNANCLRRNRFSAANCAWDCRLSPTRCSKSSTRPKIVQAITLVR